MAITPTSANSSTTSLSQKLRELGRLKFRSEEKVAKEFEIVHTPDRPTRLITPVEAPTEDECGDEIARWQRYSAKERISMFTRSDYGRLDTDESAATTESDNDGGRPAQHQHATRLVYGKEVGRASHSQQTPQHSQPLKPAPLNQARASEPDFGKQHQHPLTGGTAYRLGSVGADYVAAKISDTPVPLFSGTRKPLPPTSHPRTVSPSLAAVEADRSLTQPRYTGLRMEIYHRGFCPYCHKYFGRDSLPSACPYLDCKRDLSKCLQYPNRREAEKAPPRLAQRRYLYTQPGPSVRGYGQGTDRQTVPGLTIEGPTPIDGQKPTGHRPPPPPPRGWQPQRKSPSPSTTIRTIWPSPLGIYDPNQPNQPPTPERLLYSEKPLPPPPPPTRSERRQPPHPPSTPTTAAESIAERHRQLYTHHHITSQLRTPTSSLSSTPAIPSPLSGSGTPNYRHSRSPSPSSSPKVPTSGYRGMGAPPATTTSISTGTRDEGNSASTESSQERGRPRQRPPRPASFTRGNDSEFNSLAWKKKEQDDDKEAGSSEKKKREVVGERGGRDADLFMDIIGQYEEDDGDGKRGGWFI